MFYPPERRISVAFPSWGQFDWLSYIILGSHSWVRRLFWCWCGCGCGCGWGTFFVFKSLDNNMIYSSCIDIYLCKRNLCRTKVLWVLKFGEVGGWGTLISNSPYVGRFLFFRPKLYFLRGWVLFLVHF